MTLMSFQQLVDKHDLPRKHSFKYLQIRSFIYSQIKTTLEPSLSTIEQLTVNHLHGRDQLSMFYGILIASSKENSLLYLSAWKNDLQLDISVEDCEKTCLLTQTQTIIPDANHYSINGCSGLTLHLLNYTILIPIFLTIALNAMKKLVPYFII